MKCVKRQNLIEDEGEVVGRLWDGKIKRAGGGESGLHNSDWPRSLG